MYRPVLFLLFIYLATQGVSAAEPSNYNRLHFSVTADRLVNTDEISATMSIQEIGPDIAKLSERVNNAMQAALKIANREDNVLVETLNYQTGKNFQKGKQEGWQVSQSLSLTGGNMAQLSELIGKLQSTLQLNNISYQISADRKKQIEAELARQALEDFTVKADEFTKTLGRKNYRIVEISISSPGVILPRPMLMARNSAMMAVESAPPPSIQPGDQKISMTATGTIELSE